MSDSDSQRAKAETLTLKEVLERGWEDLDESLEEDLEGFLDEAEVSENTSCVSDYYYVSLFYDDEGNSHIRVLGPSPEPGDIYRLDSNTHVGLFSCHIKDRFTSDPDGFTSDPDGVSEKDESGAGDLESYRTDDDTVVLYDPENGLARLESTAHVDREDWR